MLENLRNMEPLPANEENRILRRLRITVIVLAVLVLAFAIWSIATKRSFSGVYYVIVGVFLFCNWFLTDVAPIFFARALAGRKKKQVNAYLKAAGLGVLANFGLGWFLIAMNDKSIYGAFMYLIGVVFARKQREIYYDDTEEEEEEKAEEPEVKPEKLPTAADRIKRLNELNPQLDNEEDTEDKDGSV